MKPCPSINANILFSGHQGGADVLSGMGDISICATIFRGGCPTGRHADAGCTGFCIMQRRNRTTYRIFGYKGKQVQTTYISGLGFVSKKLLQTRALMKSQHRRRKIQQLPMRKAMQCEEIRQKCTGMLKQTDRRSYLVISDAGKFRRHYPSWKQQYDIQAILKEISTARTTGNPAIREKEPLIQYPDPL